MARSRTAPRQDKPQAIIAKPGAVAKNEKPPKPEMKPAAGYQWELRRMNGHLVWVQVPKPAPKGPVKVKGKTETPAGPVQETEPSTAEPWNPDAVPAEDKPPELDTAYWKQFFPGLPDDTLAALQTYYRDHPNSTDAELIGFLKGTDWYKGEYGAFETGVLNGVFSAGGYDAYRNWKSSIKDAMGRYGIDEATASTVMDTAAKNGWSADRVEREFAADAYVKANQMDIQYTAGAFGGGALTQDELKALGQQQVGVGNDLGGQLQTRVQQAFQKMSRLFEGTLAVSDMGGTVQQDRRRRADVGA